MTPEEMAEMMVKTLPSIISFSYAGHQRVVADPDFSDDRRTFTGLEIRKGEELTQSVKTYKISDTKGPLFECGWIMVAGEKETELLRRLHKASQN